MTNFKEAIVKRPAESMVDGLTTARLGKPDYEKALRQHDGYIKALQKCGLQVKIIQADERFPDSVFIEDIAVVTPKCCIITLPGAPSRRAEIVGFDNVLQPLNRNIEFIQHPGLLDGGDVMLVDSHFFIGLSARTNREGGRQFISILGKYTLTGSTVKVGDGLHLKSGVSYLENSTLLVTGEFVDKPEFSDFRKIVVDKDEAYAANSVWINGKVLVPHGFPKTEMKIKAAGYEVIPVDVSEFQKLDGGLSCLSLRF